MLLSRYSVRRASALTIQRRSISSTALQKIAYHTTKKATLEPIKEAESGKKTADEPIDDIGIPKVLMAVEFIHQKYHKDLTFEELQPLPAVLDENFDLLKAKLLLCSVLCDFRDPDVDKKAKSIKAATLKELVGVFCSAEKLKLLNTEIIETFFDMLKANLWRTIPAVPRKYLFGNDEPSLMENAWSHLSIVYELLNGYQQIVPNDEHFNDFGFIVGMMDVLHAPDGAEREELKKFFCAYIKAFPDNEMRLLRRMGLMIQNYLDGKADPFCVTPILKTYIESFRTLKEPKSDYTELFDNYVLPLIRGQHLFAFSGLITQICDIYMAVNKDSGESIVRRVLKSFPESRPSKQVLVIGMLNFLVERLSDAQFEQIIPSLFNVYAKCAESPNVKVADASMQIWQNVNIIPMLIENAKTIYPMVFSAMNRTMKEHWSFKVQNSALLALNSMKDLDPFVFGELTQKEKKQQSLDPQAEAAANTVHKNWALVARAAARSEKSVNLAKVLAEIQLQFSAPARNSGSTPSLQGPKKPVPVRQSIARR